MKLENIKDPGSAITHYTQNNFNKIPIMASPQIRINKGIPCAGFKTSKQTGY